MEDSCPPTPLISMPGRNSKSPNPIMASSPDSDEMKSPSGRHSPDSRCVICLGKLHKKSFTDSCLHQFCFNCLLQWSKVKPECPLCKQPFKSIIHNVRSNFDYDQYYIERRDPAFVVSELFHAYDINLMPVERRFRYRSTMTREYFRELAESFLTRSSSPYHLSSFIPASYLQSVNGMGRTRAERQRYRSGLEFRRSVYSRDLWVQDFEQITGRYRDCSPQFFRENPAQVHRIIPWLSREISALVGENDAHCSYILDRVVSMLTEHSIISNEFRNSIVNHFGSRTDHFIHEFYTFARSVYDMTGFDCHASYGTNPNYSSEVQEISSSSCDSEVEIITSVNHERTSAGESLSKRLKIKKNARNDNQSFNSGEPVPGPSGINNRQQRETVDVGGSDSDEVKVIEYVKPKPVVIVLNSSDEDTRDSFPAQDRRHDRYESFCTKKRQQGTSRELAKVNKYDKKYKSVKGKCKSNGIDLKGEQKRDYIRSRLKRSPSSSSSCSGISDVSSASSFSLSTISSIGKTPISFTSSSASSESISSERNSAHFSGRRRKKSTTTRMKQALSSKKGDIYVGRKSKPGRKRKLSDSKEGIKRSRRNAQGANPIKGSSASSVAKSNLKKKGKVKSCVIVPRDRASKAVAKIKASGSRDNSNDSSRRSYSSSSTCSSSIQSVDFPLLPPPPPPSYWSLIINNQHTKSKKEKHVREKNSRSKSDNQETRSCRRRKRNKLTSFAYDSTASDSSMDSFVDIVDGSSRENSKRAKQSLPNPKCATLDETKSDHHHHHHHHHYHQIISNNKK